MTDPFPARAISCLIAGLALSACGPEKSESRWFAMDTEFVVVVHGNGRTESGSAFRRLQEESERLEKRFSNYNGTSDLHRIRGNRGDTLDLDPEMAGLFSLSDSLAVASAGRFDLTLGPLKQAYGLGSGEKAQVPSREEIIRILGDNPAFSDGASPESEYRSFRMLSGNRLVLLRDSLRFDLGAIAKGYAVDRLAALLDTMGFPAHLVQAGGDMKCTGIKPDGEWTIGIRHPRHPDSVGGSLRLGPSAISTSGDYERCFFSGGKRYHHILDPTTGEPARPHAAVTILAPESRVADGLSTTLFILGPGPAATALLRTHGAEALWVRENSDQTLCALATEGFRKRLSQFTIPFCPD